MSTNPYQAPAEETAGVEEELPPPRYHGRLRTIQGSLTWDEALTHAKSCEPIDVSDVKVPPVKTKSSSGVLFGIVVFFVALFVIWLFEEIPGNSGFLGWWCLAVPIGLGITVVGLAWLMNSASRWEKFDPPLDGEVVFHLSVLGCSFERKTRDGQWIEVYSSWRQLRVTEGAEAWMFQLGVSHPIISLILKDWIEDDHDRTVLEAFLVDVARWQVAHPIARDAIDATDELAESFPDYSDGGLRFEFLAKDYRRARAAVAKRVRKQLPRFAVSEVSWTWQNLIGLVILLFIPLVVLGILVAITWSMLSSQVDLPHVGSITLVCAVMGWFTHVVVKALLRNPPIVGAVSENTIWYDHRALLVRVDLSDLTFRKEVGDILVLADSDGKRSTVLPKHFFASEDDYQTAKNRLKVRPTTETPEASAASSNS